MQLLSKFPNLTVPVNYSSPDCLPVEHWASCSVQTSQIRSGETADSKTLIWAHATVRHNTPLKQPIASPLHITSKKTSAKWHPYGDYGAINSTTKPERYPIPFLQDFSASLCMKKIFSKPGLEISVHLADVPKTGVTHHLSFSNSYITKHIKNVTTLHEWYSVDLRLSARLRGHHKWTYVSLEPIIWTAKRILHTCQHREVPSKMNSWDKWWMHMALSR